MLAILRNSVLLLLFCVFSCDFWGVEAADSKKPSIGRSLHLPPPDGTSFCGGGPTVAAEGIESVVLNPLRTRMCENVVDFGCGHVKRTRVHVSAAIRAVGVCEV